MKIKVLGKKLQLLEEAKDVQRETHVVEQKKGSWQRMRKRMWWRGKRKVQFGKGGELVEREKDHISYIGDQFQCCD